MDINGLIVVIHIYLVELVRLLFFFFFQQFLSHITDFFLHKLLLWDINSCQNLNAWRSSFIGERYHAVITKMSFVKEVTADALVKVSKVKLRRQLLWIRLNWLDGPLIEMNELGIIRWHVSYTIWVIRFFILRNISSESSETALFTCDLVKGILRSILQPFIV